MAQQTTIAGFKKAPRKSDPGTVDQTAVAVVNDPEFVIEINQTVMVSKIDSLIQGWCETCGAEGQWVTPEHAAIISNTDTRSIYRRIETGAVHFIESKDGPALVCLNSLFG